MRQHTPRVSSDVRCGKRVLKAMQSVIRDCKLMACCHWATPLSSLTIARLSTIWRGALDISRVMPPMRSATQQLTRVA